MSRGIILVVDDKKDLVRAINLRLRAKGYEVVTANDGIAAMNVALLARPDLVIMDVGLPHGDGYTIAQNLLQNSETRLIPHHLSNSPNFGAVLDMQKFS